MKFKCNSTDTIDSQCNIICNNDESCNDINILSSSKNTIINCKDWPSCSNSIINCISSIYVN